MTVQRVICILSRDRNLVDRNHASLTDCYCTLLAINCTSLANG
jgi:hypothetical protein